jgi:hypothetical protein
MAAASAATTAPASAAAPAFALRPRFVDHQIAPAEVLAVKSLNGFVGLLVIRNLHKSETGVFH